MVRISKANKSAYKWVAVYWEGDKRRKKYFKKKTGEGGADEFRVEKEEELSDHGTTTTISSEERSAIAENRKALEAAGLTLRGVIVEALKAAERNSQSDTVESIIDSLMTQREREKKSQRHLDDLRSRLKRLSEDFGSRIAADIQTQEIDDWLVGLGVGERTIINYRRIVCSMFIHGVERGMCPDNPARTAIRPKPKGVPPGVLTPIQAEKLLVESDPRILPTFALGMFAGLRTSEVEVLTWGDINFEEEMIEVKISKSGERDVKMKPALLAWLRPYSLQPAEQLVRPPGWTGRELMRKAREAAGFGGVMKNAETYKPTLGKDGNELSPFPNNALRHSYGSYALVESEDAAAVAYQLGHKKDMRILFKHYRSLVKQAAAKKFWAIRPTELRGNIIKLAISVIKYLI